METYIIDLVKMSLALGVMFVVAVLVARGESKIYTYFIKNHTLAQNNIMQLFYSQMAIFTSVAFMNIAIRLFIKEETFLGCGRGVLEILSTSLTPSFICLGAVYFLCVFVPFLWDSIKVTTGKKSISESYTLFTFLSVIAVVVFAKLMPSFCDSMVESLETVEVPYYRTVTVVAFIMGIFFLCNANYGLDRLEIPKTNCNSDGKFIKIYVPKNDVIRERIVNEICGTDEIDYVCRQDEYEFWKQLSQEEYGSLDVHSNEHKAGNVLVYEDNTAYVLDGIGYLRVKFEREEK